MHVNTQISRGMERLMARGAGERLDGMFGLAGLGSCESFSELETMASEAGVPNASKLSRSLRKRHECACDRIKAALPAALNVKEMLEATAGPGASSISQQLGALEDARAQNLTIRSFLEGSTGRNLNYPVDSHYMGGLGALGKATAAAKAAKVVAKTAAKIAKVQAKEAKQEAKVAAKVAKYEAAGKTAKAAKVIAKDAKQDAKVAAKLVKLDTKLQAAQTAVATATQAAAPQVAPALPATAVTTPTETAAAVLASQSGVSAQTPAAQQLMQEVVANAAQPGSVIPSQSLNTASPQQFQIPYPSSGGGETSSAPSYAPEAAATEDSGMFGGVSPLVLAGVAGVALFLFTKRR